MSCCLLVVAVAVVVAALAATFLNLVVVSLDDSDAEAVIVQRLLVVTERLDALLGHAAVVGNRLDPVALGERHALRCLPVEAMVVDRTIGVIDDGDDRLAVLGLDLSDSLHATSRRSWSELHRQCPRRYRSQLRCVTCQPGR